MIYSTLEESTSIDHRISTTSRCTAHTGSVYPQATLSDELGIPEAGQATPIKSNEWQEGKMTSDKLRKIFGTHVTSKDYEVLISECKSVKDSTNQSEMSNNPTEKYTGYSLPSHKRNSEGQKHMKRIRASSGIREIQIRATVAHHFSLSNVQKLKRLITV